MVKGLKDKNENKIETTTRITSPGIIMHHIVPYYKNINKEEFDFLINDLDNDIKIKFKSDGIFEEMYFPSAQFIFNSKKLYDSLFNNILENNYFFKYILKVIYKSSDYLNLYNFLSLMYINKTPEYNEIKENVNLIIIRENIDFIINLFSENEINHLKVINFELKLEGKYNPFLNELVTIIKRGII